VQVFRGLPDRADRHRPIALTIGNFDGVHRGHQAMLGRLSEAAEDLALPSAVLTFDPHPREFFAPGTAPPRLSTLRSKLEQFAAHGIAEVHVARFNAALASLPAERFVDDVLVRRLGTRWVLVGDDFRFGRGRSGDLALLRRAATGRVKNKLSAPVSFGHVHVDPGTHTVKRSGEAVTLRPKEYDLLVALLQRRGQVASRAELLEEVWGYSGEVYSRTVDTHVAELRRKLEENAGEPQHILTVRKTGYRIRVS